MALSKLTIVCVGLVLASHAPVFSAVENGRPGTVNYFTPVQKARVFAAATRAGYTPTIVQAFQDGNFFLTASRAGQSYELTVVPSGQVYPSSPMSPMS